MSEIERRWRKTKLSIEDEERVLRNLEQELEIAKKNPQLLKRKGLLVDLSGFFAVDPIEALEAAIMIQKAHIAHLKKLKR